ncbi:octapeptide-repeat protein T2-like [Solanum pennellii]|uniref:Octapeptide-repeat protein T2-like n=1 Tax=Solanum pennellii TaxID=28526 RepID=A0ABM1G182_SOLPN|nr:octapeptide-repeat protein T2-like [Solanum pennellii]
MESKKGKGRRREERNGEKRAMRSKRGGLMPVVSLRAVPAGEEKGRENRKGKRGEEEERWRGRRLERREEGGEKEGERGGWQLLAGRGKRRGVAGEREGEGRRLPEKNGEREGLAADAAKEREGEESEKLKIFLCLDL